MKKFVYTLFSFLLLSGIGYAQTTYYMCGSGNETQNRFSTTQGCTSGTHSFININVPGNIIIIEGSRKLEIFDDMTLLADMEIINGTYSSNSVTNLELRENGGEFIISEN